MQDEKPMPLLIANHISCQRSKLYLADNVSEQLNLKHATWIYVHITG